MEAHKDLLDEMQKTTLKNGVHKSTKDFELRHLRPGETKGVTSPTEHSLEIFQVGKPVSRFRRVFRGHTCSAV